MRRILIFWLFLLFFSQLEAQVRYRPLLAPLFQKPTQALLVLGCCAHAVAWHHARQSKKIVPAGDKANKNNKAYEKFRHELIAQASNAVGSALFLFVGNYIFMSQLHDKKYLPPFNKRNALKAFAHILVGWSGAQLFMLPYTICKFLVLSPEWVKFLEDPTGKVQLKERLRKMIAAKINKKESDKLVKLFAKLAHTALMKDIGDDAAYIEAIAKKRAQQYGLAIAFCAEWVLLAAAYLACAS
jgi:hypothetical protein